MDIVQGVDNNTVIVHAGYNNTVIIVQKALNFAIYKNNKKV